MAQLKWSWQYWHSCIVESLWKPLLYDPGSFKHLFKINAPVPFDDPLFSWCFRLKLPPADEVWGKVIRSQASVCPQGVCGRHYCRQTPLGQTPWWTHSLVRHPPGRHPTDPAPRNGHWSGRYASYWNAFLFLHQIRWILIVSIYHVVNKFVEKVEMKVVIKYEEWEFFTFLHKLVKKNNAEEWNFMIPQNNISDSPFVTARKRSLRQGNVLYLSVNHSVHTGKLPFLAGGAIFSRGTVLSKGVIISCGVPSLAGTAILSGGREGAILSRGCHP